MGKSKTHTRKRRVRRKTRRGRGKKKVTFAPMRPSLFSQNIPLVRKRNLSKTYYRDSRPGEGAHTHLVGPKIKKARPSPRRPKQDPYDAMKDMWDAWDEVLADEGVGSKYEGGFRRRKKTRRRPWRRRRRGRQHF